MRSWSSSSYRPFTTSGSSLVACRLACLVNVAHDRHLCRLVGSLQTRRGVDSVGHLPGKLLYFCAACGRLNCPRSPHIGQVTVIGHAEHQPADVAEILTQPILSVGARRPWPTPFSPGTNPRLQNRGVAPTGLAGSFSR